MAKRQIDTGPRLTFWHSRAERLSNAAKTHVEVQTTGQSIATK